MSLPNFSTNRSRAIHDLLMAHRRGEAPSISNLFPKVAARNYITGIPTLGHRAKGEDGQMLDGRGDLVFESEDGQSHLVVQVNPTNPAVPSSREKITRRANKKAKDRLPKYMRAWQERAPDCKVWGMAALVQNANPPNWGFSHIIPNAKMQEPGVLKRELPVVKHERPAGQHQDSVPEHNQPILPVPFNEADNPRFVQSEKLPTAQPRPRHH
ncbi:hypothetical protein DFS34DRAFT_592761 [Phlyctochytrium arcticum]|nr:hypothetical protein DFS34DRAFT_592761 [Phlyctochytrium arcticum]